MARRRLLHRLLWLLAAIAGLALSVRGVLALGGNGARPPESPVYYVVTRQKAMALTFDIGWGEQVVHRVLDVLRRYDQRATFFVSGPWALRHPEVVRTIVAAGHELASHGEEHVNLSGQSDSAIAENIRAADRTLRLFQGNRPIRWLRPPNGDWNARVVRVAHQLGYEVVIWSIDSVDWKRPGVDAIASRVLREVFPGAIILFHASDSAPHTPDALPVVFDRLKADGWRLVPLGELAALGPLSREDNRGRPYKPNWPPEGSRP